MAFDELVGAAFGVQEEGVEILHGEGVVAGVLVELFARDLDAVPIAFTIAAAITTTIYSYRCISSLGGGLRILLGDLLADGEQSRGDIPKGAELRLCATEDVLLDHGQEALVSGQDVLFEGDGAVVGVAGEEGGGFTHFIRVVGLLVGEGDDGLVFGVALGEEVEDLAVEVLARFEKPF